MRILCILAAFALSACTSGNSGPTFGAETPLGFQGPLLPNEGGPATPVQRHAPTAPEATPAPAEPETHGGPSRKPIVIARPEVSAPGPTLATTAGKLTAGDIRITYLLFDDRRCDIIIADKEGGLNSEWQTAATAGAAFNAVAAINGGFFTPEGNPLGLVVENGKKFGSWNASSSITSGVLIVGNARSGLARRERWSPTRNVEYLLQAGPLLLEGGRKVAGLSTDSSRPRSFMALDGQHHWLVGYARTATLDGLAAVLATQPVPGIRLRTALNLDGGSSSDFWISPVIKGGPVSTRQFWNKPVRNYVLILEHTP